MNIALEKTEEYVGGVKRRTYGDAFVRGNNGESALLAHKEEPEELVRFGPLALTLCDSYVHFGGLMRA
jgi:hypothetical protein